MGANMSHHEDGTVQEYLHGGPEVAHQSLDAQHTDPEEQLLPMADPSHLEDQHYNTAHQMPSYGSQTMDSNSAYMSQIPGMSLPDKDGRMTSMQRVSCRALEFPKQFSVL